jgi:hypothetical protein
MKIRRFSIVVSFFISSCQPINTDSSENWFVLDSLTSGKFISGYLEAGSELTFSPMGKFEHVDYINSDLINPTGPSQWITTITGKYQIDSGQIKLTPEVFMKKEGWADSIAVIDSIKYLKSDLTRIRTSFHMIII